MTIGTECPHCESVFQVAAELAGKSMRCPNPTCREVFTVEIPAVAAAPVVPVAEVPSVPDLPVPTPTAAGTVADYLPVFEAERIDPPAPVYDAEPLDAIPRAKAMPAAAPIPKAAPLPPVANAPRAPQILDWSEEQERKSSRRRDRDDESDVPIRTRPRGMGLTGKVVFGSLVVLLVVVLGGTLTVFLLSKAKNEEQEAKAADALFQEAKYTEAKRKFESLAADFPDSSSLPKYKFFVALSQTQADASSVTVKDDPTAAQRSLAGLIAEYGESPLAQPNSGFGADVVLAGKKVAGAVGDHAGERVKQFQAKRSELKLLDAAEKAIADGRAILPTLEKFRDKSGLTLDDERAKFDTVEGSVRKERDRLAALAPWRDLATDPTDVRIDEFEKAMKAAGLDKDGEAQLLSAKAKKALRDAIGYKADPQAAGNPPLETGATLTAAARVAGTPDVRLPTGKADAVFGIAHGVLYALDHRTGEKLWAERVSAEVRATDAPLRITLGDSEDWVLVPNVKDGQAAITARDTMKGEPKWHQPLPAPVLGKPVRIGDRLIVPLADDRGTLIQLNAHDGTQLGKVELRQAIGGGISALRGASANSGFVVVPADARRVFVFEVGKPGEDGKRQPPQVVRVIATGHTRGSLRGPPLVIDPEDPAQPRRVILAQSDGPTEMRLRSFPLPAIAELGVASPDGDIPPSQMAEASVGGWSWFPPLTDGERVAVCTDKGVFAAFGLNLPGQADKPLYQLPGQSPDADPIAISRSQVVWMDEDTFWVIVNGKLVRLKVASDPRGGMKIVPAQESRLVGEPVAAAQVRPTDGIAVITTKATETGTLHLQAFNVNTGEELWRRQLGAVATAAPVVLAGGSRLLVDECGGIYTAAADAVEWKQVEKCEPAVGCVTPAVTAITADGSRVWVAVHVPSADGVRLLVRVLKDGKPEGDERTVTVPAGLAGNAVAVGDHLLFPLANKFLYRLGMKDAEPTQGPAWAGPKAKQGARCHLSASADGLIAFGDGDTQLLRRKWPADKTEAEKAGGPWELTSPMTAPAVSLSVGGKEWLVAADNFGVGAFDPSKPTTDPVRRWQGGNAELPIGRAAHLTAVGGKVCWSAGGRAVAMADPDADKPQWVFPVPNAAGDVVGLTADGEGVLVTCSSGVVLKLNVAGEEKAEASLPVGGPLAKAAAVRVGDREVLLPLADGTASRLTWNKR